MARIKQGAVEDWIRKYSITSHWNLITYVECQLCRDKYVREWGWQFSLSAAEFYWRAHRYICKRCCPKIADVALQINTMHMHGTPPTTEFVGQPAHPMSRPPAPPPGPPLRIMRRGQVVNKQEIEDWVFSTKRMIAGAVEGHGSKCGDKAHREDSGDTQ